MSEDWCTCMRTYPTGWNRGGCPVHDRRREPDVPLATQPDEQKYPPTPECIAVALGINHTLHPNWHPRIQEDADAVWRALVDQMESSPVDIGPGFLVLAIPLESS